MGVLARHGCQAIAALPQCRAARLRDGVGSRILAPDRHPVEGSSVTRHAGLQEATASAGTTHWNGHVMTAGEFIAKWRSSDLKECSAAQEHFIDLCPLLGEPTRAEAHPLLRPPRRDTRDYHGPEYEPDWDKARHTALQPTMQGLNRSSASRKFSVTKGFVPEEEPKPEYLTPRVRIENLARSRMVQRP